MNIAVCGIGKAGKVMAKQIIDSNEHKLVMVINRDDSTSIGKDVGELLDTTYQNISVVKLSDSSKKAKELEVDVLIDFSNSETTVKLLNEFKDDNVKVVVCTTNFSGSDRDNFEKIKKEFKGGIVYAPALTIGINLVMEFVSKISKILPDFDFEIVERHPKGKARITTTAKLIAKTIERDDVNISSVRLGGYVGVHEVTAASPRERITIEHESFTREAFAYGAMLAAKFIKDKNGYYEMNDVISELEREVEEK